MNNNIFYIHPDCLFIDGITITYPLHSEDEKNHVLSAIQDEDWFNIWANAKGAKSSYQYKKSVKLKFPDSDFERDNTATLEMNPWNPSTSFIRLDYNPTKISYHVLAACLESILPYGIDDIYETGNVTRLDIAMDVIGVKPRQVILDFLKTKHRKVYAKSGMPETVYIGDDTGENELVIYDKIIEMESKKLKIKPLSTYTFPKYDITRIEMRYRPKVQTKFMNLHEINNVFKPMIMFLTPLTTIGDSDFMIKRDLSVYKGVRFTDNDLKKSEQQDFREKLMKHSIPDFLDIEKLWETFPKALNEVFPKLNQV
jgi:hypothetical protein